MPVIALTGATGFVGRSIVEQLRLQRPDCDLRLLVRNPANRFLPDSWNDARIELIPGGLDDADALESLTAGSDSVVHIAAAIAGNSQNDFERTNLIGTRRLLDALSRGPSASHLVVVSSLAARHPDLSWYAASKRAAEELVRARCPEHSIIRPPAVYGPDDPALADFWKLLARGWLLRLGAPDARFSLLHVDDLAQLIVELLANPARGRIVEPCGPQPGDGWTWPAIAEAAARVRGGPVRTLPVPRSTLRAAGAIGPIAARLIGRTAILNPGKVRELHHVDWVCDNLRALPEWRPSMSLEQALPDLPGWRTR
jgi:nucleoside-diphosphate-sugar epimerase